MKIRELSKEQLNELMGENKWFEERVCELAQENAGFCQSEEYKCMGADAFDYHDHYTSFYLSTPTFYGAKCPEKIAGKLDKDYLSEEDRKLYEELCELNAKMEDAEEWDEDRPEYARMTEIADLLAEHITEYLRGYEELDGYIEQELDDIIDGYSWLGDLDIEDGVITEIVKHK